MRTFYSSLSVSALILIFQFSICAAITPDNLSTPVAAPYFENFDQVTGPDLPAGWGKIVEHSGIAQVNTVTYGPPMSPPNNVRLYSNQEQDANVMLITPLLGNPSQNRIRFWARASHTTNVPSLIIGTLSDPEDSSTFSEISTIPATNFPNTYHEYIVNLDILSETQTHIAFKFGATPSTFRTIYIDDFHYEPMPPDPVFHINNLNWDFGEGDIVESSLPKIFSITNEGLGQLQIHSVILDNNDDFILDDLGNFPAIISGAQTADFSVIFSPEETGPKTAQLTITYNTGTGEGDEQAVVSLQGEGVARPAGSTCGNPYYITDFPVVDFQGNTNIMGDFYSSGWVSPASAYMNGNDMVFQFTLDEVSYVSGSLVTPQTWVGMLILDTCPNADVPAEVINLAGTSSGNSAYLEEFTLEAGTYFLIVGSFPPPQTVEFTLNLNAVPVPPDPEFSINPNEGDFDFGQAGINALAEQKKYSITNTGGGLLEVIDIEISGDDNFSLGLENFDFTDGFQGIELGEVFNFNVLFSPDSQQQKTAQITITYRETETIETHVISLSGEGVNVNVTSFPWAEGFEQERFPPLGWSYVNGISGAYWDRSDWVSFQGSYSARAYQGSESGHLADEWLITPPIELPDVQNAILSFQGITSQEPEGMNGSIRIYVLDEIYDNAEDLAQNAQLLATRYMNQTWQHFTSALQGHSGTIYLAFRYDVPFSNGKFNWIFIDDIKVRIPGQAKFTVVDQASGQPVQGAYVNLNPEGSSGFFGKTDNLGETTIDLDDFIGYQYTIRAAGYLPQTGSITPEGELLSVQEELHDRVVTPQDLTVEIQGLEPGEALLKWSYSHEDKFRYDEGVAHGQLGSSNATYNTVLGAAHRNDARLEGISWFLTNEGGAHALVKVWVFGLDADGMPNADDVLFSAENVANTNLEWNTFVFPEIVEAPNGFLAGISFPGFLGLGTDSGTHTDWPFRENTNFFNANVASGEFVAIENLGDFSGNLLIRAWGYDHENFGEEKMLLADNGNPDQWTLDKGQAFEPVEAEAPVFPPATQKDFKGYQIFLDEMQNPVADGIHDMEYLFTGLAQGEYTAGVRASYPEESSDISTIEFSITNGFVQKYNLTLLSNPEESGLTEGSGEYEEGETIALSAMAHEGYIFIEWTDQDGIHLSSEPSFDFTMPAKDVTLKANFSSTTGISHSEFHSVSIYPNPGSDFLTIESENAIRGVKLISMSGIVILEKETGSNNKTSLAIGHVKTGVYLLHIITQEGLVTRQVIISR